MLLGCLYNHQFRMIFHGVSLVYFLGCIPWLDKFDLFLSAELPIYGLRTRRKVNDASELRMSSWIGQF